MKKIFTLLFSLFLIPDLYAQCSNGTTAYGNYQALIPLGSSYTALDYARPGTRLWADPALIEIILVRMQSPGGWYYDISKNGGVIWTVGQGALSYQVRNPQAALVNPSGFLNPDSAWVVHTAGQRLTNGVLHGQAQVGSASLPYSIVDSSLSQHSPSDFFVTRQGTVWSVEGQLNGNSYNDLIIVTKGLWNSSTRVFDYSSQLLYAPVSTTSAGSPAYGSCRIAFGADGMTGYVVMSGHYPTAANTDPVYFPVVFKTTNGGSTWGPATPLNLAGVDTCFGFGTNMYSIWVDFDIAVDVANEVHILCTVHEVTLPWTFTNVHGHFGIFDIYSDNTLWKARFIRKPQTFLGNYGDGTTLNPIIDQHNEAQIATDSAGQRLFYVWAETDTLVYGTTENVFPDLHIKAYDIPTQMCSNDIEYTSAGTEAGQFRFHSVSYYAFTNGAISTLPVSFARMTNAPIGTGDTIDFKYLDGIVFTPNHFLYSCPDIDLDVLPTGIEAMEVLPGNCISIVQNSSPDGALVQVHLDARIKQSVLRLYTMTGKTIFETNMNPGPSSLSISSLPAGIYLYELNADSGQSCRGKFIIL